MSRVNPRQSSMMQGYGSFAQAWDPLPRAQPGFENAFPGAAASPAGDKRSACARRHA